MSLKQAPPNLKQEIEDTLQCELLFPQFKSKTTMEDYVKAKWEDAKHFRVVMLVKADMSFLL